MGIGVGGGSSLSAKSIPSRGSVEAAGVGAGTAGAPGAAGAPVLAGADAGAGTGAGEGSALSSASGSGVPSKGRPFSRMRMFSTWKEVILKPFASRERSGYCANATETVLELRRWKEVISMARTTPELV